MLDSEIIRPDNADLFCNTNEQFLKSPARGILPGFPGLGGGSCLGGTAASSCKSRAAHRRFRKEY